MGSLPSWAGAKRVAVDIETCDPRLAKSRLGPGLGPGVRRGGYICGVSFAIEDGPAFYLPIRHENGANLDSVQVLAYLRTEGARFAGDVVGANINYDLDYLAEVGVEFPFARIRDVQVAEPLIDELQWTYSLDEIAKRWGLPGKDETLLREAAAAYGLDPKQEMYRLPPEYVGAYAEQDARLPLTLLRRQEERIDADGLWDIYNLESDLTPVLVRMRRRGVAVSEERLARVEAMCLAAETQALAAVRNSVGVGLDPDDVWSTEALERVLRAAGVSHFPSTATGKVSIDKEYLKSLAGTMPVAKLLATARRYGKVRTTFVKSIRTHATNGRIHCTFKQLRGTGEGGDGEGDEGGAKFGRCSSAHPNLQQQPARDPDIGPLWRSIYLPDEGKMWATCDYSQQEPRWIVHYAELTNCKGSKFAGDRYRTDPSTDFHQLMADLTRLPRKQAKDIFLGKCYGMGGAKYCRSVGLPTEYITGRDGRQIEVAGPEGRAQIEQFDNFAPFVREINLLSQERAAKVGYIRTVGGRRCRFPKIAGGYDWTHKALNRLIQGSSADQTKMAMVKADRAGIPIQLQVHDEIDFSAGIREEAEALADIMRTVVPCVVPMKIDTEVGPDWGHTK